VNVNKCAKYFLNLKRCRPGGGQAQMVLPYYGTGSFHEQVKKILKNFISEVLGLLNDLLYLKTDVNVCSYRYLISKKSLEKNQILFWHLESH
jgi:hypothetical protein